MDKKSSAQKLFGLNLFLKNRRIEFTPATPSVALRATRKIFSEKDSVVSLRTLYAKIRLCGDVGSSV